MSNTQLKSFWETVVPKSHKHFIHTMDDEKISRLNTRVQTHFLEHLDFGRIKTALDWGCGGGLHTKTLSELCEVTPVDISQESLDSCEAYSGVKGRLLADDLASNEFATVDLVFCADVIHHFPSLEYFEQICQLWNRIAPDYLCVQFKSADENREATDYFDSSNYVHGLFLTKEYVQQKFPGYAEMAYGEESSKSGTITHGFLTLKNRSAA